MGQQKCIIPVNAVTFSSNPCPGISPQPSHFALSVQFQCSIPQNFSNYDFTILGKKEFLSSFVCVCYFAFFRTIFIANLRKKSAKNSPRIHPQKKNMAQKKQKKENSYPKQTFQQIYN